MKKIEDKYNVIFSCHLADYWWVEDANLSLEEAEITVTKRNNGEKIHGGCCQYYVQKCV